jgi:hypothetical protein
MGKMIYPKTKSPMPHEKGEMGNLENASLEFDLDMPHEKG